MSEKGIKRNVIAYFNNKVKKLAILKTKNRKNLNKFYDKIKF